MKEVAKRMKKLREDIGVSQAKFAELIDSTQSSVNRYENGQATPPVDYFRKFADYFDISLDYLFCRTDEPQGKLYECKTKLTGTREDMREFIEMCFEPGTPMNGRLKEMLLNMMEEGK